MIALPMPLFWITIIALVPPFDESLCGTNECGDRRRIVRIVQKNSQNLSVRVCPKPFLHVQLLVGVRRNTIWFPERIPDGIRSVDLNTDRKSTRLNSSHLVIS